MADRIVVGYWDCTYCNKKGISGLEKHCPSCGNPQGGNVKLYMKKDSIEYLDEGKASEYGKGADWKCDYCGSYNRHFRTTCSNCGSSKADSKKDYFDNDLNPEHSSRRHEHGVSDKETEKAEKVSDRSSYNGFDEKTNSSSGFYFWNNSIPWLKLAGITAAIVAMVLLLIFIFAPREYLAQIHGNQWKRTITIQEYKWVNDDSWYSAPDGARNISHQREIYTYDQVLDHYESVQVQKSREVFDHTEYDTHVSYSDNGDGTFTEHSYTTSRDVYRTEYYYDTEERPIYKSVPRYEEHYYYEIQKWVFDRTEVAEEKNNYSPYWPEYSLASNERISNKSETYILILKKDNKEYSLRVPESYLNKYKIDSSVKITVVAGVITKINGETIKFN